MSSLTTRERILIIFLLLIIGSGAFYMFVYSPLEAQIESWTSQAEETENMNVTYGQQVYNLNSMKADLEDITTSGLVDPLPDYDNIEDLLLELNTILADTTDYNVSFTDPTGVEGSSVVRRTINLSFETADYATAKKIIAAIEDGPYRNQIENLSFSGEDSTTSTSVSSDGTTRTSSGGGYKTSMTVTYYEYQG